MADAKGLILIEEGVPLLRERKGGAVNLIFAGVLLEAVRMIDDGFDNPSIERAAHSVFRSSEGIFVSVGRHGTSKLAAVLESYAEGSDPEDPLYRIYHNFFAPPACLNPDFETKRLFDSPPAGESPLMSVDDPIQADLLRTRFMGTAFMISVEVVDSGIQDLKVIDRLCRRDLGWKEGPFAMMNRIGIGEAMRIVTKKLEQSHRKEINFPVPALLIEQARREEPWPLNSHARR